MFYCSINLHGWKTSSTSTLVNVQLQKMILKKISLSWWTTWSLVSLFIFKLICSFMFLCFDSFIDSFIAGKTIENLRNRCMVDQVTSEEKLEKLATQHFFKKFKIFNEKLVAVEWAKVELMLNQLIYVGFAILDLSKMMTYDLHYNYITRKHPYLTLLFTNTDSLTYQIKRVTCAKTFMLTRICSIFLGKKKKVHSAMVKIKK